MRNSSRARRDGVRSLHRQRGVAAVFAGIALIGILTALAFAVDLAQLYQARRSLQQAANAAALDAAMVAGCSLGADDRELTALQAAQASVTRHGMGLGWLNSVTLGVVNDAGGLFQFAPSSPDDAYAVEVGMSRPMPSLVMPLFTPGGDGTLKATAAAARLPEVGLTIGTYLASVAGPGTALDGLLSGVIPPGDPVRIASYNGLVDGVVPLGDVADSLGLDLDELINNLDGFPPDDGSVTGPDMLEAIADALVAQGDTTSAAVVQTIADQLPDEPILPIIDLPPSAAGHTVEDVRMAVIDMVQATVSSLFEDTSPPPTPTPAPPLPSVGGVDIELLDAPQPAVGPPQRDAGGNAITVAETAQARLALDQPIGLPGLLNVNLSVGVNAAKGRAELRAVRCSFSGDAEVDVGVTTSIASADVELVADVASGLLPGFPQLLTITLSGALDLPTSPSSHVLTFYGPYPQTCSVPLQADDPCDIDTESGSGGQEIGSALIQSLSTNALTTCTTVAGGSGCVEDDLVLYPLVAGTINSTIATLVANSGLIGSTVNGLFDAAFGVAGVALGGADVTVDDVTVPRPLRVNLE